MRVLTPAEVAAIDDAYVIDVREAEELARARVETAHHLPLSEFMARRSEVPTDRTVYLLCHSGARSAQAAAFLESEGYDAVNVDGGIVAWAEAGLPVIR